MNQAFLFLIVAFSLFNVTRLNAQIKDEDWQNHRIYKHGDSIIIFSEGKNKIHDYSRKIFLKKNVDSSDTTNIKCSLDVEKIRYYDKQGVLIVKALFKSKEVDSISVYRLLEGLVGIGKSYDAIKIDGNNKMDVDCETLREYMISLPDKLPRPKKKTSPWYKWFVTGNAFVGASWNSISVDTPFFSNTAALTKREQDERRVTASGFGLSIGHRFAARHAMYVEVAKTVLGFESRFHKINWNTGMPETSDFISKYKIKSTTLGLGYWYSNATEGRTINLLINTGVYATFTKQIENNKGYTLPTDFEKRTRFTVKLGIGAIFGKRDSRLNGNILPFYMWDITPLNRGQLSTLMHAWGVNAGVTLNICRKDQIN